MSAGNKRNARTTHPRKAQRRIRVLAKFTLYSKRMGDAAYMARKQQEYLALGGSTADFASVPQRLSAGGSMTTEQEFEDWFVSNVGSGDPWEAWKASARQHQQRIDMLRAALEAAQGPLDLYHAYGWPDRDRVCERVRAALSATKPEQPQQPVYQTERSGNEASKETP